jgi:integrase
MSSVSNHAIRWEFADRNPITGPVKGSGVRVSAKRERTPEILEVQEMQLLIAALGIRERAMVFLDMPSGRRRGELAGLKWEDFDFKNLHVSVTRSLVDQRISRIGSLRVEQILMLGIQDGNRRLARRPPIGESSNVIVPS